MRISDKQTVKLMKLLMMMKVKKPQIMEISAAMETTEMLKSFLDKLSERNYEMTPKEVYQASVNTSLEFQTA